MKKFILTLFAVLGSIICASAQESSQKVDELYNEDFCDYTYVRDYYNGCLHIAKAENPALTKSEKFLLYDTAIKFLEPISVDGKLINRYIPAYFVRVDGSVAIPTEKGMQFTYQYAIEGANKLVSIKQENKLLRGETDDILSQKCRCRVATFTIAPGATVKYKDIMNGTSIVIAMCEWGAKVELSVESYGKPVVDGKPYENGMVSFCKWESPKEQDFIYSIKNKENREINVVVIAN